MKHLISHLVKESLSDIVAQSYLNCHTEGLHSIMLINKPGQVVRLFIATHDHTLWRNLLGEDRDKISIAFHPHHCNITLHCVKGSIYNMSLQWKEKHSDFALPWKMYRYNSGIHGKGGTFELIGEVYGKYGSGIGGIWVNENQSLHLHATDVHTVGVKRGQMAAWFVYEGEEDTGYVPYCLHAGIPDVGDMNLLYKRPTEKEVTDLLNKVFDIKAD